MLKKEPYIKRDTLDLNLQRRSDRIAQSRSRAPSVPAIVSTRPVGPRSVRKSGRAISESEAQKASIFV